VKKTTIELPDELERRSATREWTPLGDVVLIALNTKILAYAHRGAFKWRDHVVGQ
jgi:hypothetical protein